MKGLKFLVCFMVVALTNAQMGTVLAATDGELKITLLGTGTPLLNINRFGMSTLVEAGNHKFLFDVGRGATLRLHQAQVHLRDIEGVFITHMHSDHLTGFPDLYASAPLPTDDGRSTHPLELYGPVGVDQMARGVEMMFAANNKFRLEDGETNLAATKINVHFLPEKGGVAYDKNGVKVTAFLVNHGHVKPAYGYRIDYNGRSLVLSGDTTYSRNLVTAAKGVDLLVHCLAIGSHELEKADPQYVNHFYTYLANPEMLGKALNETHPKLAVISHISLYSRGKIGRASEKEIYERVSKTYDGKFIVGQDLMSFKIDENGVTLLSYDKKMRSEEPVKETR